jgi:hypothetical protein
MSGEGVRRGAANAVALDHMMQRLATDAGRSCVSQIIDPGQGSIKRRACARPG